MRSLKVRPASLFSSIRYSKFVISPCLQLCVCVQVGGEEDVFGANIYTLVLTGIMGDRPCGDLFQFLRLNLPGVDQVRQVQLQQFRVECIPLLSGMEQRQCGLEQGQCQD